MKKTLCVLSVEETGAFELHRIYPNCANHVHIKLSAASRGVAEDRLRFVGSDCACTCHQGERPALYCPRCERAHLSQTLYAVTEQSSNKYVWKNRISGGQQCRQMRRVRD